jgi:hypothetical protein
LQRGVVAGRISRVAQLSVSTIVLESLSNLPHAIVFIIASRVYLGVYDMPIILPTPPLNHIIMGGRIIWQIVRSATLAHRHVQARLVWN